MYVCTNFILEQVKRYEEGCMMVSLGLCYRGKTACVLYRLHQLEAPHVDDKSSEMHAWRVHEYLAPFGPHPLRSVVRLYRGEEGCE